jgi:GTP-binding protein YchF
VEIGLVGLPNVGKSTLFNALARACADASNYPYCTIDPNVAVVEVPDERLDRLGDLLKPAKLTHPTLRFVDIAGLARGASKGEGLGNMFLSHIRDVDAVAHVVRCFSDPSVVHVEGEIDPERDIGIIETELFLADLEVVDRRLAKLAKVARAGDSKARKEHDFLLGVRAALDESRVFERSTVGDPDLESELDQLRLLTSKPSLLVANVGEDAASGPSADCVARMRSLAAGRRIPVLPVSAKIEAELSELPPEDAAPLLREFNFDECALERFVRACYGLLEVVTFFTIKGEETRGWTVCKGTGVREAAGKIHTDMYNKFVCAEVVAFDDLMAAGGMREARENGLARTEGREYIVRDGDVVLVKFGK